VWHCHGVSWELVRLSLHVTAATIWVGGQLVLAALLPALRRLAPDAPRIVADAFGRVAWPAFALLIVTGAWNVWAVRHELHGSHLVVLYVKLGVVVLSGATAEGHTRARTLRGKAVLGAGTGVFALVALVLGLQLTL
jgi:putative copper export protein